MSEITEMDLLKLLSEHGVSLPEVVSIDVGLF